MCNKQFNTARGKSLIVKAIIAARGQMQTAFDQVGVSKQRVSQLRAEDPAFDADCKEAQQTGLRRRLEHMESKLEEWAEGWEEPVFYRGDECGTVHRHDTTAAIVIAKATARQLGLTYYDERRELEHSGVIRHEDALAELDDDEQGNGDTPPTA